MIARYALGLIILLAALSSFVIYAKPSVITVVADGDLHLYDKATTDPATRQIVATLKSSDEIFVDTCVDLKHYLVPQVTLAGGEKAYVIDGPFHLRRERALPFFGRHTVVWKC